MIFLLGVLGAGFFFLALLFVSLLKTNVFIWSSLLGGRPPFRLNLSSLRVLLLMLLLAIWTGLVSILPHAVPLRLRVAVPSLSGAGALLLFLLAWAVDTPAAERIVKAALPLLSGMDRLVGPLLPGKEEPEEPGPAGEPTDTELKTYIDMGMEHGILEAGETQMLESLLDFSDTLVREVMTPRSDMVTVASGLEFQEVLDTFIQSHFSRLPVTGKSLDDVTGIVYLKDFVRVMKNEPRPAWTGMPHPAMLVPETKRVKDLMKEMREGHLGMAIVVDEYGGTAGLVTLEDLLEEIVGEIEDEQVIPPLMEVAKGKWSVAGKVHIEELSEALGLDLENPEVDTVAGFISAQLGRIPRTGDTVAAMGAEFTVESADERRVYRVLVRKTGS